VQQMVEESVEHAFEDLAARRWVEAKLKAKELVGATRKGMEDVATELAPTYREQLDAALMQVDRSLASENAATETGDLKGLQAACAGLDEITKPLAEHLMDKAMEAMLKRKGIL